jgi:hypothetical protein
MLGLCIQVYCRSEASDVRTERFGNLQIDLQQCFRILISQLGNHMSLAQLLRGLPLLEYFFSYHTLEGINLHYVNKSSPPLGD